MSTAANSPEIASCSEAMLRSVEFLQLPLLELYSFI